MLTIIQAETPQQVTDARTLFREYEAWLGLDLCFQGFEAEMASLPGKYAPPSGRLLLASDGEQLAGCVAMRSLADNICEMKRLFVRDEFRGQKIGLSLIKNLLNEAHLAGYKKMRLDTYPPKMPAAVELYESHGFYQIAPYYENPHEGVLFMEATLGHLDPPV